MTPHKRKYKFDKLEPVTDGTFRVKIDANDIEDEIEKVLASSERRSFGGKIEQANDESESKQTNGLHS